MRFGRAFVGERRRYANNRSIIISESSAMPCENRCISHGMKNRVERTHLLLALLQAQTRRELYEIPIDARDDTGDGRCSRDTTRPRVRNINPNEDSLLPSEPSKGIASKPMINPAQLSINLEGHIRQILILFALIERLFEQQALRSYPVGDRA